MSRVSETLDTMEIMKQALYGKVEKPVLHLIPILCQIALSLAEIADNMAERRQDG